MEFERCTWPVDGGRGGDRGPAGGRREGAVLGFNLGRPIVTYRDFATRLFPNYSGQYLFHMF